uniref:NACHT, LRR and PYD domains-containing protein 1 isoform X2 n=1 Tax=Halichoerus grypus TaxID=9711 RepID=UPI0016597281|nr:NACHT, LRR and PYD domains-containing protein 1 isoform X2 [Halichoerus grypus]
MGLSRLCAQARAEAAFMPGNCPPLPCSPSAAGLQSPSGPTSTEVLRFVQDAETGCWRQPPDTSGHTRNRSAWPPRASVEALVHAQAALADRARAGTWNQPFLLPLCGSPHC